ncbi:DUF5011 domain-containing protein [Schleiferilactobacillus harbinensis]|uniref:SLAP domain-containing protein n=1 Tax=Schleiferilactobacillus harbinensis TaxID=304207 RepID=UPI001AB00818|nr:SLAP domain-containing protein [Schleiferilactobacillus harbinensis]MBO3091976.1 DUF5011 domain-containing protein [Schleiferilactobacillus harbinensis]
MKKFSKVKYFGAVAAALLAVAPIAAPVVSQVAAPVTVQAAAAKPNGNDNTAWATALDTVFRDALSTAQPASTSNADNYYGAINTGLRPGSVSTEANSSLILAFFKTGANASQLDGTDNGNTVSLQSNDFKSTDPAQIKSEFVGNSRTKYSFTITLKNRNGDVLATKDVTLNVVRNSKATVTPATFTVGDSTKSLTAPTNVAASLKLTDNDGHSIGVTDADIRVSGYQSDTNLDNGADFVSDIADAVYHKRNQTDPTTRVTRDDGSAFANNGVFYQKFYIPADEFGSMAKYSNINVNDVVANSNGTAKYYSNGTAPGLFFLRQVTVNTGTNDQAYLPVLKYTVSGGNSATDAVVNTYYNGETVDKAGNTFYAGSTADDGATYHSIAAYLRGLADGINGNPDIPGASQFEGYENSIKNGGLSIALGAWSRYTIAGETLSGVEANDVAAIATGLHNTIKNPYAVGTYNVPVTVTNQRSQKSTFYIPISINTNVGTPVATEFTGYTEITKGTPFDASQDVQFQNSSTDHGIIPSSRIQVSSNVDSSTPGTYTVTYTVTNTAGKSATFTRTVVVKDGALTESNASGVVYINNASGAKVYSDTATSKETGNTLDNTTAWKYSSIVKDASGKIVAYNLGGKQYVKAADVSTSPVKAQAGVFTVHYPANAKWSIAVYNSDLKVQKLIPANSTWLTFGTKTFKDGKSYYNLGGNQWVRTDYGFWNAK